MYVASRIGPREEIKPLDNAQELGVLQPLIVRSKNERFEVVAGHRRLETLKKLGAHEAPCRILELSDEQAAKALFGENHDRQDFSDYERGLFFKKYIEKFGLSEREAGKRLGVDVSVVSLCLSVVRGKERVLVHTNSDASIYESVVTANKIKQVNSLPEEKKAGTLQAVVENRLSTDETKLLVSKVEAGQKPEDAANQITLQRERRKPQRHDFKRRGISRISCSACGATLHLKHGANGKHRLVVLKGEKL